MRKTDATGPAARNVDEYLAGVPKKARSTLEKLRRTIKAAAPMAAEVISYQMPMYKHHGMVIGFAAFKNHCSIFPGSARTKRNSNATARRKALSASQSTTRCPPRW